MSKDLLLAWRQTQDICESRSNGDCTGPLKASLVLVTGLSSCLAHGVLTMARLNTKSFDHGSYELAFFYYGLVRVSLSSCRKGMISFLGPAYTVQRLAQCSDCPATEVHVENHYLGSLFGDVRVPRIWYTVGMLWNIEQVPVKVHVSSNL